MNAFNTLSLRFLLGFTLLSSVSVFAMGGKAPAVYEGEAVPKNMALIGDSISAGMLAGFKRQTLLLPWNLLEFAMRGGAALGMGNKKLVEYRNYSWGTGQSNFLTVPSHALRLQAIGGEKLDVVNAAISGAEVYHVLNEQLPALRAESQRRYKSDYPEYVVLLIGANDTCAPNVEGMTSVADFEQRMAGIADEILVHSPNTKFLISSIPNITSLQDVARHERTAHTTCGGLWKTRSFCNTLMNLTDPTEKAMVAQRVLDFNSSIKNIVDTRRAVHGDRVRYADETFKATFTVDDLSPDCFHPNVDGQAKIAEASFKSSWWQGAWETGGETRFAKMRADEKRHRNMGHPAGK